MKAVRITQFATQSTLTVGPMGSQKCKRNHALIDVHYASVNPIDWKMLSILAFLPRNLFTPVILGRDFSGTITELGANVTGYNVGDRVFGVSMNMLKGTFAEHALVNAHHMVKVPETIGLRDAAALATVGITVLQCLRKVHLAAGERIVIVGASGGIGTTAVQIAKAQGAHVTGICSAANCALVRSLGADQVVDYGQPDFLDHVGEADVVFDAAGTVSINQWKRVLSPRGRFITIAPDSKATAALCLHTLLRRKPPAHFLSARPTPADLQEIMHLVERQHLRPIIDSEFSLADINTAFARSRTKRAHGKIVIKIKDACSQPAADT